VYDGLRRRDRSFKKLSDSLAKTKEKIAIDKKLRLNAYLKKHKKPPPANHPLRSLFDNLRRSDMEFKKRTNSMIKRRSDVKLSSKKKGGRA